MGEAEKEVKTRKNEWVTGLRSQWRMPMSTIQVFYASSGQSAMVSADLPKCGNKMLRQYAIEV